MNQKIIKHLEAYLSELKDQWNEALDADKTELDADIEEITNLLVQLNVTP